MCCAKEGGCRTGAAVSGAAGPSPSHPHYPHCYSSPHPISLEGVPAHHPNSAGPHSPALPAAPARRRDSIDREGADQEELDPEDWEGEGSGGASGSGGDEYYE